jgi:hypothetical protein
MFVESKEVLPTKLSNITTFLFLDWTGIWKYQFWGMRKTGEPGEPGEKPSKQGRKLNSTHNSTSNQTQGHSGERWAF